MLHSPWDDNSNLKTQRTATYVSLPAAVIRKFLERGHLRNMLFEIHHLCLLWPDSRATAKTPGADTGDIKKITLITVSKAGGGLHAAFLTLEIHDIAFMSKKIVPF